VVNIAVRAMPEQPPAWDPSSNSRFSWTICVGIDGAYARRLNTLTSKQKSWAVSSLSMTGGFWYKWRRLLAAVTGCYNNTEGNCAIWLMWAFRPPVHHHLLLILLCINTKQKFGRGMATLPQGNQELLVVRDKVGRPPGERGVSKSIECDIFPSVLWHCWLGNRKGIRPVKKLDVGLLVVMIW